MAQELLDIWGDPQSISEVIKLCEQEGVAISSPLPRVPSSDALDAPIAIDTVRELAVVVTAVLNAGVTAALLTEKVVALLKKKKLAEVKTRTFFQKQRNK
jgi:hypothetical protein